ncbi:MAG: hypothetical protein J6S44_02040 [Clostridia bacterium]|nr:hypothetical protein [Clostridia bacterium]
MSHHDHYFASFSYGATPRLFGDEAEIRAELDRLSKDEEEAKAKLEQAKAAVKALNTLTLSGTDAEARVRILTELSAKRKETEELLDTLRERKALLKEEWEDACFYLKGSSSRI